MSEFEPLNLLEEKILQAREGELDSASLFQFLQSAQAVMLLDKPLPASGVWDNSVNPLVLDSPNGFPVLAIFSATERANPSDLRSPQHTYALQVDFKWLIRGIPSHVGIVMNPNHAFGFEIPPLGVADLKHDMGI